MSGLAVVLAVLVMLEMSPYLAVTGKLVAKRRFEKRINVAQVTKNRILMYFLMANID
jgi:hypothetical protein